MVGDSKGRLLKMGALCIVSMVLFLSYSGCIDPINGDSVIYIFTLEIFPENETEQFQVLLPIPINDTDEPNEDFIRDAVIEMGSLNLEINETPFGPALLVNGTGDSVIQIETFVDGIEPEWILRNLSLQVELSEEEGFGRYRVQSNMDNISLHMVYDYDESTGEWFHIDYEMITIIHSGWQEVLATINEW
jgi:hypothetical protein